MKQIYPHEHDHHGGACYTENMDTLVHVLQVVVIILGVIILLIIIGVGIFAFWVKRKVNILTKRFPGKGNIVGLIVIPFLNFLLEIFKINADSSEDERGNI